MQCIKSFAKLPFWVFAKAEIFSFVGCLNKIPIIIRRYIILNIRIIVSSKILNSKADVGWQRCPDFVRKLLCGVSRSKLSSNSKSGHSKTLPRKFQIFTNRHRTVILHSYFGRLLKRELLKRRYWLLKRKSIWFWFLEHTWIHKIKYG